MLGRRHVFNGLARLPQSGHAHMHTVALLTAGVHWGARFCKVVPNTGYHLADFWLSYDV